MPVAASPSIAGKSPQGEGSPALLFLHIPKTAGRTLEWMVLARHYSREEVLPIDVTRLEEVPELIRRRLSQPPPLRLVSGHFGFGWHRYFPGSRYFTLLRHPVSRVVSLFYHLRRDTGHSLHGKVQDMNLAEFLESGLLQEEVRDGQCRLLAGALYGPPDLLPPGEGELLETARRNLGSHFLFTGISERFDESLLLLKKRLGWGNVFYARQNVGRNRPSRVDPELEARILEWNRQDWELYRWVQDRLEEEIRNQGPVFQRQIERFRRLNRLYQTCYPLYRPLRNLKRRLLA